MKVQVKLFSVLREYSPNYDPELGVQVELPLQASVDDLLHHFNIPPAKAPVVTCEGRVLKAADALKEGSLLHIFQPVAGG